MRTRKLFNMARHRLFRRVRRRDDDRPEADREASYPPPYPHGWYRLADSDELGPGDSMPIYCLGQELVLFRGEASGELALLDAHCCHQGANLAAGGEVVRDDMRCPFHHWTYDCQGQVTSIPTADTKPKITLRVWPVREVDGMVWAYHGPEGESAPPYEPRVQPEIASGQMVYRGSHDGGTVRMHLIEFAENSVDFQHFKPVHGQMLIPWTQIKVPGITVHHTPDWSVDSASPYISYFLNHARLEAFGRPIPRTDADAKITFFGPGGVVYFEFQIPDVGRILMYQTHLPLQPMKLQVNFRWFADKQISRPLVSYVVGSWISQWQADIEIWENKIYRQVPCLMRSDGPVRQMRQWFKQFYPAEQQPE